VFSEEISEGEEGCCKKIVSVRKIDLDQLAEVFGLRGEMSGFEVGQWISPISFRFVIGYRRFVLSDVGASAVAVTEE
jgi:hypothetical protein